MTAVSVPQQDGEIVITKPGETGVAYPVTQGTVDVPADEVAEFLTTVTGSQLAKAAKAAPVESA